MNDFAGGSIEIALIPDIDALVFNGRFHCVFFDAIHGRMWLITQPWLK